MKTSNLDSEKSPVLKQSHASNPIGINLQFTSLFLFILLFLPGCISKKESIQIEVQNGSSILIPNAIIRISDPGILKNISSMSGEYIAVKSDDTHPVQSIQDDGNLHELLFSCDLGALEKKTFLISKSDHETAFKRCTQAELSVKTGGAWQDRLYVGGVFENIDFLRVPDEHTDHSSYIRYEGPGWGSDRIGYRFYLDWRNAIDIFGKKVDTMVLQNVGKDGFDSYHELAPWGVDVLQVGESLGMGSVGYWHNDRAERVAVTDSIYCEITYSGILESKITTTYFGWKIAGNRTDLTSQLSIQAGSRLTMHELELTAELDNFCTGIVKHPEAEVILPESSVGEWTWLANYGKQTLQEDMLGMAILYRQEDLIKLADDELNHVVILKPSNQKLTYFFLAAWEQEPGGIKNKEEFIDYLGEQVEILNHGLLVE